MASTQRQRKNRKKQNRIVFLAAALFFVFCCVITAGEAYGWQTPRWADIEAALGVAPAPAATTDGQTEIHFIDVGQADATLIRQNDEYCLIDAGDVGTADQLVAYLKSAGVTKLRCVVMTHPHADHIGGMPAVLQNFTVDEFILPDFTKLSFEPTSSILASTLQELQKQKQNGCKVVTAERGQEVAIGDGTLRVLLAGVETDNTNNLSVCTKFTAGSFSCLFTGDGEAAVEKELLAVEPDLRATLFHAAHHGSSTSNTAKLLAAVKPSYIIISCGLDNSYGHPHAEILKRFQQSGAAIYRTDHNGSIVVSVSPGGEITVHPATESEAA